MPLEHEALTRAIIGAAIAVHRELGPGFLEAVYDAALLVEMRSRRISFERQVAIPVLYRGVEVGLHRLDLLVGDQIVVELKAVKEFSNVHFAVVRSYLRAADCKHGLILNFAKPKMEMKRVLSHGDVSCDSRSP